MQPSSSLAIYRLHVFFVKLCNLAQFKQTQKHKSHRGHFPIYQKFYL